MMCSATDGVSLLSGMVPMYVLMSAFHSAPWLKLIFRSRHWPIQSVPSPRRVPSHNRPAPESR